MVALFEDAFIDVHKPLVKRAKRAEPAVMQSLPSSTTYILRFLPDGNNVKYWVYVDLCG